MNDLFARPESNYLVGDEVLDAILADPANPLANIVSLIEPGAVVLDIGAGNGLLGRVFERLGKPVIIDAIEPNAYAASLIPSCYREVNQGYLQDFFEEIQSRKYDYVVMADVIEHIPNPQPVLNGLLRHMAPDAKLLVSLPNVAFAGVRIALLRGQFNYTDSGILERTHLRFYTLDIAKALFSNLGLHSLSITFLQRSIAGTEFSVLGSCLHCFTHLRLAFDPTARAYQYLFLLSPQAGAQVSVRYRGTGCSGFLASLLGVDRVISVVHRLQSIVLGRIG